MSYPRISSRTTNARPLESVQSEGGSLKRRLGSGSSKSGAVLPLPISGRRLKDVDDNTSDESGGEEVIVRIDSPSTLSFPQASGTSIVPKQ